MKKYFYFIEEGAFNSLIKRLFALLFLTPFVLSAQVSFTHTTNDDFNQGTFNDLLVASNTVSLPFQATSMGSWLTTTVIPQTLSGHQAATWNNRFVYVTGGYNGVGNTASVYRAILQTAGISGWTAVSALPEGVRNHATIIGDNAIYVIGGITDDGVSDKIYYATMNLNGNLGQWQLMNVSLPSALQGHTAVYSNGFVYVAGGSGEISGGEGSSVVYYAQVLANGEFSEFVATTGLPQSVKNHTMVVDGEELFVLGGENNEGNKLNAVYKNVSAVDGTLGVWNTETSLPVPVSNHASFISNGLLVVMGGENETTIQNAVVYADVTSSPLVWESSTGMVDYVKDFVAFGANGQVVYSGGSNLSGVPIHNSRYAALTLSTSRKTKGLYVSTKFDELGAERIISELAFVRNLTGNAQLEVSYRIAGNDGAWSNWTPTADISPIEIEENGRYLQYKVKLTNDRSAAQATLQSVTMRTPGSQLSGNISGTVTYTKAASPYWVTANIAFTGGTHTFEAGTEVLFLPETTMTVAAANIICNGVEGDSVYFTGYLDEEGLWGGILFNSSSNIGVSSQFNYVVISNAGHGTNNANLFCDRTTEPRLNNCVIKNSTGRGIRLQTADIHLHDTKVHGNASYGVSIHLSSPTFVNTEISGNRDAGVMISSDVSKPTFTSTSIRNNLYGIYYHTSNTSLTQPGGNPLIEHNQYDGIVLPGGDIVSDVTWHSLTYDIIIIEPLTIRANRRLTIEPGNTIKALEGVNILFGTSTVNYGELYAVGAEEQPIRFTSYNGVPGGWDGIHLRYRVSGQAPSELVHCIIENGREYNLYADGTVVNSINSVIQNSAGDGARYNNSYGVIDNCQVLNNGSNGVFLTGTSNPEIRNSSFAHNADYPLFLATWNSQPFLENNSYTNNGMQYIALSGGNYTSDYVLYNDGLPYHVLNDMVLYAYRNPRDFVIKPGVELLFDPGVSFDNGVSNNSNHAGNLLAVGTDVEPIVFKAFNDTAGGWDGINFYIGSNTYEAASLMQHCIVEQGNEHNLLMDRTTAPTLENSIIRNALNNGVYITGASPVINNCLIFNNGSHGMFLTGASVPEISNNLFSENEEYPLFLASWNSGPVLQNNTYSNNGMQYIAVSGGYYTSDYVLYNDGVPYHVLNDMVLYAYRNPRDFVIEPGVELLFDSGVSFDNGVSNNSNHAGNLLAVGTDAEPIVFKAFDDTAGGWNGINFYIGSNTYNAASMMKYCIVEQGNEYNIFLDRTTQPAFENNVVRNSAGLGMRLWNSQPDTIRNSSFMNNAVASVYLAGTSDVVIGGKADYTCNFYNTASYAVYNNTGNLIDARYNFWESGDSAMISNVVYDTYNNATKGKVSYVDFAQVPYLPYENIVLSGTLVYANASSTPLETAELAVKAFTGEAVAQTTSSETGSFDFAPFITGGYQMEINPVEAWGGVNATDALLILNHFTKKETLTGMNLAAADVNLSGSVNGTDALFILKRYAGLIDQFPSGDYLYHMDDIEVNGNVVTNNIRMLCFGDVNSSYTPLKGGLKSSVNMESKGEVLISSGMDFELPFEMEVNEPTAAVSFGFYFPAELMEVTGVDFEGPSGYIYNAKNGLFRFAWAGTETVNSSIGVPVRLTVKMRALEFASLPDVVYPELYEKTELANQWGEPMAVKVSAPDLRMVTTGMELLGGFRNDLTVYPNPFSNEATVGFTLESQDAVSFTLFNAQGIPVFKSAEKEYPAGHHQMFLDGASLKDGLYILSMRSRNAGSESVRMIKVIVSK